MSTHEGVASGNYDTTARRVEASSSSSSSRAAASVLLPPWIVPRRRNSNDDTTTTTKDMTTTKERSSSNLVRGMPSLLLARSLFGSNYNNKNNRGGHRTTTNLVATDVGLSMAGAWNSRRMQNMTLAIGPGTPAWNVDVSSAGGEEEEESMSSSSLEGEEEDDDEDDDDDEEEEEEEEEEEDALDMNDNEEEKEEEEGTNSDEEDADEDESRQVAGSLARRRIPAAAPSSSSSYPSSFIFSPPSRRRWSLPGDASAPSVTQSPAGCENEEGDGGRRSRDDSIDGDDDNHDDREAKATAKNDADCVDVMEEEEEEEEDDDDDEEEISDEGDNSHHRRHANDDHSDGGINNDDDDDDDEFGSRVRQWRRQLDAETQIRTREAEVRISSSSMRHGGCINTASWLDCGWRISARSPTSLYSSNDGNVAVAPTGDAECPTQLLTSGDDVLVKFWDARESMGSTSPLPGGSATCTPYSSPRMPVNARDELIDSWRGMRRAKSSFVCGGGGNGRYCLPGTVHPLATMNTGHRGNVFHATPVPNGRGKVVTCGADGQLRLHDVAVHATSPVASARPASSSSSNRGVDSSAIVISPQFLEDPPSAASFLRSGNSPMCFSHHFLSPNVGLVCSERGLLHFDLRLPPRSQKNRSIVPELSGTCKACYPWRLGENQSDDMEGDGELESAYVFAGGSNDSTVGLYDLRMTGSMSSSSSHVVQKYRPRALRNTSSSAVVAISGIDLSKNKRELLVSYESDQIYTFPIFEGKIQPTLIDIEQSTSTTTHTDEAVPELATYGGHLNRLTFLKSAKYAGPNDEYICTGSDSGHAWIYEKKSGSVVSLIKADSSTCNGIQPHPTLPIFITYGIDSTAKLWRATSPVDMNVDDSDLGRFNYHSKQVTYQKSMVVDQWKRARRKGIVDLESDILSFFPDEISEDDNDDQDHFFSLFIGSRRTSKDATFIGNDMMNLSNVVSKNYFTCARSIGKGSEEPVKSGVATLKTRVSLIKLRHQADILGLDFDSETPWIFKHKEHMLIKNESTAGSSAGDHAVSYGCLADLIPDNPSDWLPFDKLLSNPPHIGGMQFNSNYKDYYLDSSADRTVPPISRRQVCLDEMEIAGDDCAIEIGEVGNEASSRNTLQANENPSSQSETPSYDPVQAWDILLQTVASLKEAGNEALKASLPFMAARRYDKAISYCSVAYIQFPVGTVDFLARHQYDLSDNGGYEVHWNELLKLLIVVRLNLARVYLVKEINDANGAATQASLALNELKPFIAKAGIVRTGKKLVNMRTDEQHSTYFEAKALQAKAYFRLGSAQLVMSEYDEAVKTFEHCVASTKEANLEVDAGVLRKINEAKRCRKEKKETQRKKFKHMFSAKNGT